MERPDLFVVSNPFYWVIRLANQNNENVDSIGNPIISIRKNGQDVSLPTTIVKRVGSTGIYDVTLDTTGLVAGDQLSITEEVSVDLGDGVQSYYNTWNTVGTGSLVSTAPSISGEYLTSKEEIERVFTADGVSNHLEDTNDTTLTEIINRASEKVLLYLRTNYKLEDMMTNVWVREQATYIACYLISIRAGDPSLYTDMYQQVLEELQLVRSSLLDPGIASKPRPVVQTPIADNRYTRTLRTDPRKSTQTTKNQIVFLPFGGWYD